MTRSLRFFAAGLATAAIGLAQPSMAWADGVPMVIQADTVQGGLCTQSNQFKRSDMIVWRVNVIDTQTGKPMMADTLASVTIELPDGSHFSARYGKHPPENPADFFWAISWVVPQNYPTGTFSYKVIATDKKGQQVSFEPFKVHPSQLTIVASK